MFLFTYYTPVGMHSPLMGHAGESYVLVLTLTLTLSVGMSFMGILENLGIFLRLHKSYRIVLH